MTDTPPSGSAADHAKLEQRVTSLEELLTHVQHTSEELSRELFAQMRRVEAVQHELGRLIHKLDNLTNAMPSAPRDLVDEKPPHY